MDDNDAILEVTVIRLGEHERMVTQMNRGRLQSVPRKKESNNMEEKEAEAGQSVLPSGRII